MKNVEFSLNGFGNVNGILGKQNKTLDLLPLVNSDFSFFLDALNCSICNGRGYNSSGGWTVDSEKPGNLGSLIGKSVKDSVCLSNILDSCYSSKTEDHYEFFLVQGSKLGYLSGM